MEDLPQQIGRYPVERLLGSGSMGHVYLAHDLDLDRPVALKTLRDVDLDDETRAVFISRFQNEARAAARLQHPNIVQIFDAGDDPKYGPYLVFEYVEGPTLKQRLRKDGPLGQERLLTVSQQIADALSTAHMAGVIHRDLKPENLLVTANGQVKLADFGIARVPNADLTKEGQFLGTPCYSAPETLRKGEYDEKTDLFSFGAVLYEAACGERAFPGGEAMIVANNVMNHDPVPPSEANRGASLPAAVDEVIMRSLSKEASERFPSARALVSALRDAYDGKRPAGGPQRKRWWAVALVVGAVLATWALVQPEERALMEEPDDAAEFPAEPEAAEVAPTIDEPEPEEEEAAAAGEPERELSPHELEEAAKDELARARTAIAEGNAAEAKAALDLAAEYDPNNPDVAILRAEADALAPEPAEPADL
ncbi:MAG: serine/threonine-protein kinase [Myxococcota bacterium]